MNHTHRSIRSFLTSRIPSTGAVIGGSIVIAGIASAANVGSVLSPLPTGISTGDTIEAVHITNIAGSITRLDNRTFQKDGSEARFNFPYLSTGNARPAGTEIHIWDDGTLQAPHKIDTGVIKFEIYPDEASLPSPANEGSIAYVSELGIYFHNGTEWIANGSGGTGG